MEIVIDEWLLEYLTPNSESTNKIVAKKIIFGILINNYKILLRRPSPFLKKFYHFMKTYGYDLEFKSVFSKLNMLVLMNSAITIYVDDCDVKDIPNEIIDKIPDDDLYLIEAAFSGNEKLIITTDGRLKDILETIEGFQIYTPDDFIIEFL